MKAKKKSIKKCKCHSEFVTFTLMIMIKLPLSKENQFRIRKYTDFYFAQYWGPL